METGKLPNDILERIVLNKIHNNRDDIILRPGIGEDCSAVEFGEYACVLSTDPITGTAKEIGRLAVHISCNDIASSGVEPIGLMVTILCPPDSTEAELGTIMDQLASAAESIRVDILGGHTEITPSVNRFIIACTAVGRCLKGKLITTSGAQKNDYLVLTKHAGLEGTSIIAHEKEEELLKVLGKDLLEEAKGGMAHLSVVKEGILAARFGVHAMHDVTEGGVFGAVWEMCEASGNGAEIYAEQIPVNMSTKRICEYYNIDPYRLMSSGCMLIAAEDGEGLARRLKAEGIEAAVIGRLNETRDRLLIRNGKTETIPPPGADELYRVL